MKKLSILFIIFTLAFISCGEETISQKEKREARQDKEIVKSQKIIVYYEPATLSDDGNSYWFVVVEKKGDGMKLNTVLKQNHRHFSIKEAKAAFDGGVFILNFVQVSKETYEE